MIAAIANHFSKEIVLLITSAVMLLYSAIGVKEFYSVYHSYPLTDSCEKLAACITKNVKTDEAIFINGEYPLVSPMSYYHSHRLLTHANDLNEAKNLSAKYHHTKGVYIESDGDGNCLTIQHFTLQ